MNEYYDFFQANNFFGHYRKKRHVKVNIKRTYEEIKHESFYSF